MNAVLLAALIAANPAAAQEDDLPPPPEAWMLELEPEEQLLLERLEEWEGTLDPAFIERLEFELSGGTVEHERKAKFHMGFEAGTIVGLRGQFGAERDCCLPYLGLRLGAHTWVRSDVALQPVALGYVDFPFGEAHLIGSYGQTRRDGVWGQMGGAAIGWDPWEPLIQMQAGLLWGPGFRSIDVTYAWMW